MLISTLFFSFVFSLYFAISFTCHWCYCPHWLLPFFHASFASAAIFRGTEHEAEFGAALRTKAVWTLTQVFTVSIVRIIGRAFV